MDTKLSVIAARPSFSVPVIGIYFLYYPAVPAIRAFPVITHDRDRAAAVRAFLAYTVSWVRPWLASLQSEAKDQTGYEQRCDYDHHCFFLLLGVGKCFM